MIFKREDIIRGWKECPKCNKHIWKLEAGFDCKDVLCGQCNCWVADKDEFLMKQGIEILSKE